MSRREKNDVALKTNSVLYHSEQAHANDEKIDRTYVSKSNLAKQLPQFPPDFGLSLQIQKKYPKIYLRCLTEKIQMNSAKYAHVEIKSSGLGCLDLDYFQSSRALSIPMRYQFDIRFRNDSQLNLLRNAKHLSISLETNGDLILDIEYFKIDPDLFLMQSVQKGVKKWIKSVKKKMMAVMSTMQGQQKFVSYY